MNPSTSAVPPRFNAGRNTEDVFFYFVGVAALVIYSYVIYQNTYNMPKWDDFPEVLLFLDRWLAADNIAEKFSAFISQTNEHILLVNHLIILAQYYLGGQVNFASLIYIGNIFYIGSSLALWRLLANHNNQAFSFAIVMLIGVTFYSYDSTLWAMTAISNQAVIFFSFLSIYAITKRKCNILVIMLLSILAVFSQSNGLIILVVIGVYFFSSKNWRALKQWLVFSVAISSLYALWFNPASLQNISLPSKLSIIQQLPLQNYLLTAPTFLAYFAGSIFSATTITSFILAVLIGSVILAVTLLQIKHNQFPRSTLLILGFLLLSIISIAAYRGLLMGPGVAFVSRYKMYSAYFLVTGIFLSPGLALKLQKSRGWKTAVLALSALYFAWSFPANLPQAKIIDTDLFQSLQRWTEDGDLRRARGFFIRDADSYLFAALKNKTYSPMVLLPKEAVITEVEQLESCPIQITATTAITSDFSITHKNPNAAAIKINSLFEASDSLLVALCSAQLFYQFELNADRKSQNTTEYFVSRDAIAPGEYKVWVKNKKQYYGLENPFINKAAAR